MCPESHPKRAGIPECPDWLSQMCPGHLSALAQLCLALHCGISDFTAETSLVLEKTQISFTAHCSLPFYYSVICSEKLANKSVLVRVQLKFCSYQCLVH